MSGVKKVSLPSAPVVETRKAAAARPDDVAFPSVKDLKAKFNTGDSITSQQIITSNKEKQKRHSYAHGHHKVEITGPAPAQTENKRASKTPPTTPTTPTVLKVKTTSNPIFDSNGTASKQNGTGSPATTPNKLSFQNQRSSVILHVQAGERVSSQQETVELRKKVISDGSTLDSVRRITSQFNDLHNQTTTVTSKVENIKRISQEVEKIEEDGGFVNGRRMSTPSSQFLQSTMSETGSADREELNEYEREEDHDDLDVQVSLNDDQEDERPSVTEMYEDFQDNRSEHEEAHENVFDKQEELSEHNEDAYEQHENAIEHHEEHNELHENAYEHHEEENEEHNEHHEEHNEHHEEHDELNNHLENDYEHNEHHENANENNYEESAQNEIYSEINHEDSGYNLESEVANELQEAEEVIEELAEHRRESLNEHEED